MSSTRSVRALFMLAGLAACSGVLSSDSYSQQQKILPSVSGDTAPGDRFGGAVGIDGDWAVMSAFGDDDIGDRAYLTFLNGNNSGSAFVFRRDSAQTELWVQAAKLLPADASESYADDVAISGNTIVVGASSDSDQIGNGGGVYVYDHDGGNPGNWTLNKVVYPDVPRPSSRFAQAIDLHGDILVVGAPAENTAGTSAGAAYVFERHAGGPENWGQVATLMPAGDSEDLPGGQFGVAVSVDDNTIVVGAIGDDSAADNAGAIYLFGQDTGGVGSWGQIDKLTAESQALAGASLGSSVAIAGDIIAAGANTRDEAFVFERNMSDSSWSLTKRLESEFPGGESRFGEAVAVSGETVFVGDGLGPPDRNGTVYVFDRSLADPKGGDWGIRTNLYATDRNRGMDFGQALAVSGDDLLAGSPEDDDFGTGSGSAFIFSRNESGPDAWGTLAEVNPGESGAQIYFGQAVAVSGNTMLVAAPEDRLQGQLSGSVTVLERDDNSSQWLPLLPLEPIGLEAFGEFGSDLDISGDHAIVGFRPNNGIHGAYLFSRNEGGANNWGQVKFLEPEDPASELNVAIDGRTAVVGNYQANVAYVFEMDEGGPANWGLVTTLSPAVQTGADRFGWDVSIGGDLIVVGAQSHDLPESDSGAVYVYGRHEGGPESWGEIIKLSGSDAGRNLEFGESVDVSEGIILVGASAGSFFEGAAYVFQYHLADGWVETARLSLDESTSFDFFGDSVAISSGMAIISAGGWDSPDIDPLSDGSGAVFVYSQHVGGTNNWGFAGMIQADDAAQEDGLADVKNTAYTKSPTVAIDCDIIVAGASRKDTLNVDVGAAYAFFSDALLCSNFEN